MCLTEIVLPDLHMAYRIQTLHASDPPDSFPDPAAIGIALGYPDGLVAIGGDLSPERLLEAYRHGIFPWFNEDQPILWWSPDPRAVIFPESFHMGRSLARIIRNPDWQYSLNQAFPEVISGCASNRGEHGTWITPEMQAAYATMHELGYAHSVESWYQGQLAGGIYGLKLGNIFFGESMYTAKTGGSKVALSGLISICLDVGIKMLDCQMTSEHLETLGMVEVSRNDLLRKLRQEIKNTASDTKWGFGCRSAADLIRLRKTIN
jgi:leucyl/phenylalanyl-tRNA--protein transferase